MSMDIVVECAGLASEASFWQAYLDAAKPAKGCGDVL